MDAFEFDLQRFADDAAGAQDEAGGSEDAGGAEAGGQAAGSQDTQDGSEPQAGGSEGTGGTILGAAPKSDGAQEQNGASGQVPAAYDFRSIVPEGMEYDEASAKEFGELAKAANLSQEQAGKIAEYGMQYMQKGVAAVQTAIAQQREGWADEARTALGNQFDATVARAAGAIDRLSTKVPGLRDMLNETGAGNRTEMIQLLAAVGSLIGEDDGHSGGLNGSGDKTIYNNTDFSLYK